MLYDKVRIATLPTGGEEGDERRLFSPKGELAQIINGTITIQHLVYWDLDSSKSGQTRGNHYHKVKRVINNHPIRLKSGNYYSGN